VTNSQDLDSKGTCVDRTA